MRRTLSLLFLFLVLSPRLFAQPDMTPEGEQILIALIVGVALISVALTCMIAGGFITIVALSITALMTSFGVISTDIVLGLYKKSLKAGFVTLVVLACAVGGIITGLTSLYAVNRMFKIGLPQSLVNWSGVVGGLLGGILLSHVIISFIGILFRILKAKLSPDIAPPNKIPS